MRDEFEYEGTPTGEFRSGLYVTYCQHEYPSDYLGMGRFILYSEHADENFTFPTADGKFLLQTDLRDEYLTRASEIRMVGIIKVSYESVVINDIFEEGILITTKNRRLAFQLGLNPHNNSAFSGIVDRNIFAGIYEERDHLWNPSIGIYTTFCQALGTQNAKSCYIDTDRMAQLFIV